MSEEAPTKAAPAKASAQAAAPANPDLSSEIERAVVREPSDRVKCVRVFGDFYRCNWWSPAVAPVVPTRALDLGHLSNHHVRKSQFLNVKTNAGQLQIKEVVR